MKSRVVQGPPGCLAGDTVIRYRRGKRHSSRQMTLAALHTKFNGLSGQVSGRGWDLSMKTQLHSYRDDGTVAYNNITAVVYSGDKECICLSLSNGEALTCTRDHPILTDAGFVEAGTLCAGDEVIGKGTDVDYTIKVTINKITYVGVVPTYDIAMEAPHHNFLASGIFVHNTGKSTYLLKVCDQYVEAGARVCFVSHTKAAAQEITDRLSGHHAGKVVASTIHSLVYGLLGIARSQVVSRQMLVDFGKEIGVTISGDFDITGEQERYIEEGDEAMSIIGRADARMVPHMEEYKRSELIVPERSFRYISEAYKAWKKEFGYIDFNDMLTNYLQSPMPLRYDVLIVDEAQDLSQLQWAVVDELVKTVQWCVVAGDMDQALFVWGGASPSGMNAFGERHGSDSHVLTQSYRIPSKVHKLAMSVRSRIKEKNDVAYKPRPVEGSYGFHTTPDSIMFDTDDTMILYRTHSLRRELESVLIDRMIPFTCMNGMPDPWSGKWGKAVTAYRIYSKGEHKLTKRQATVLEQMSWFRNIPTDKHWSQVLNIPDRFKNYMVQTEGKLPTIRLSTIHGAKGKEADRVILYTGMTQRTVDGMVRDQDAEHRVFYVGVTRAKERLDIVQGDLNYDIY